MAWSTVSNAAERSKSVSIVRSQPPSMSYEYEYVSQDFSNRCLRGMVGSVRRLQVGKQLRRAEIVQKLPSDKSFEQLRENRQIGDRSI